MKPTREQIEAEPAGRRIEYWLADYVTMVHQGLVPHYSEDMTAAWQVVEHIAQTHNYLLSGPVRPRDMPHFSDQCFCEFDRRPHNPEGKGIRAYAETIPLAISRAALLVVLDPDGIRADE
jgi:hypothetical protein